MTLARNFLPKAVVPLIAATFLISPSAQAQNSPINPFTYTCGDLLAAAEMEQGSTENTIANLMVLWAVGYFYGRLESLEASTVTSENFDLMRNDMVGALTGICPNIPEMPIASFATNLADDFERSLTAN